MNLKRKNRNIDINNDDFVPLLLFLNGKVKTFEYFNYSRLTD